MKRRQLFHHSSSYISNFVRVTTLTTVGVSLFFSREYFFEFLCLLLEKRYNVCGVKRRGE